MMVDEVASEEKGPLYNDRDVSHLENCSNLFLLPGLLRPGDPVGVDGALDGGGVGGAGGVELLHAGGVHLLGLLQTRILGEITTFI